MALPAFRNIAPAGNFLAAGHNEQLRQAKQILRSEAAAIVELAATLGDTFVDAVSRILAVQGNVLVSGMGKAGLVGKKLAATLASTGTPSHFVHPAEAIHGDLGRIGSSDLVLMLSYSGETEEVTRILPFLREGTAGLIAVTGAAHSTLAKAANTVLLLPTVEEACHNGLAPSTSTTMMLALGDAIALVVSKWRGFSADDFARYHPGGSLGKRLRRVDESMRLLAECRVAPASQSVRQVIVLVSRPGRRTGAVMLTDNDGRLCGIFTDSDLARLLEQRGESQLDAPIAEVMTRRFTTIRSGAWLKDAVHVLANRKISELPVVNERDEPIGLIDITDVLGIVDRETMEAESIKRVSEGRPSTIRLFGEE